MPARIINGKCIELDAEGFMVDAAQWDAAIARALAHEEGIPVLTERHFVVLEYMRREFRAKGTGPTIRRLTKESGVPVKELYELFPGGPARKAARIAGIRKPEGCV